MSKQRLPRLIRMLFSVKRNVLARDRPLVVERLGESTEGGVGVPLSDALSPPLVSTVISVARAGGFVTSGLSAELSAACFGLPWRLLEPEDPCSCREEEEEARGRPRCGSEELRSLMRLGLAA